MTIQPGGCQQPQERTLAVTLEDRVVVYLPFWPAEIEQEGNKFFLMA